MPILFYAHVLNPNFYCCILINKADHTFHFHAYDLKKNNFDQYVAKRNFICLVYFLLFFFSLFFLAKQKWSTLL